VSGVMAVPPVDDAWFDEADWLADALAFALADDDALAFALADADPLVLGEADVLAAGEDPAVRVGVALVQVAFGVAWIACWCVASDVGLVVGLGLGDTLGVGVPLGLALGLTVALGLLVLALAEALALGLVVLPLLWLPLDDAAGAVAFPVLLLAALVAVRVAGGCVDGDAQELCVVWIAPEMPGCELAATVGTRVPPPSAPALGDGLLLKAELMSLPTCATIERAGGMTARTTPKANTAAPTAKAGRSIASRQSVGRFGARRASRSPAAPSRLESGWSPPRTEARRRPRPARKPEMASHTPRAPVGRLAWAGRDRILSRIRSSPSAPGST
jgi:hypothetical protein